jgi:hypothetical protein
MNAKPGWLKGVFERANETRSYHFETGETQPVSKSTNLEKLARHCEEAFGDVQVQRAVLDDARNHVVQCEGELMKAELELEKRQADYIATAAERKGVPCPTTASK